MPLGVRWVAVVQRGVAVVVSYLFSAVVGASLFSFCAAGCWVLASFSLGALGGGVLCGVLGMILCMVLWF